MLAVFRSNRIEELIGQLAQTLQTPLPDIFAPEVIVVQGRGMERWLSVELAKQLTIWANPGFYYPRGIVQRAFDSVLGPPSESVDPYEPQVLMWSIAKLLPSMVHDPCFEPIQRYLSQGHPSRSLLQLSERIAKTFDDYIVYRPQMVLRWQRGETGSDPHEAWQAKLWSGLEQAFGPLHMAARAMQLRQALARGDNPDASFPSRLSIFCLTTMAPLYAQILTALAPFCQLSFYILSPSQEYWSEIRSQKEITRQTQRAHSTAQDMLLSEGHPLLASLGHVGRDFQRVLEGIIDYAELDTELYRNPGQKTVLTCLQSDILTLQNRAEASSLAGPYEIADNDTSIAVHSCHSPMREVEVLYQQLLALFDQDHTIEPTDVVVMTPDIDGYAPLIDAVFGGTQPQSGAPFIPHSIADRGIRISHEVVDAFLRLLDTVDSRTTASEILDLLSLEVIHSRFGMAASDLEVLQRWIRESGIRWGRDPDHRQQLEQPPCKENTWLFGLERLFLGYALDQPDSLFAEVLPYDGIEGSGAILLGQLAEFCKMLFQFQSTLAQPKTIDQWYSELCSLLERSINSTDDNDFQHQLIRTALATLKTSAQLAGFDDPVELEALRTQLDDMLQDSLPAHGFLTGGITFCAFVPMRTIPFKVVCLLGMNGDKFPRIQRPLGFDLISKKPQPGDRSSRDDDRYLFLEALLSARQRLLITYVGQNIRDNSASPPSLCVTELLDTLGDTCWIPQDEEPDTAAETPLDQAQQMAQDRFVLQHPLQPFSPRYFGRDPDPRLFSYSQHNQRGAASLQQQNDTPAPPFLDTALPLEEQTSYRQTSVQELVHFFKNPARALLQKRLQLRLGADLRPMEDREPMHLAALDQSHLGTHLLQRALAGVDPEAEYATMRARGVLPLGVPGRCAYDELALEVRQVAQAIKPAVHAPRLEPLEIDDIIGNTRVTGLLKNIWPHGLVHYSFVRLGPRLEIEPWIQHLLLCCKHPGVSATLVIGRSVHKKGRSPISTVCYSPVDNPQAILRELLTIYWLGHQVPLPLFPLASWHYANVLESKGESADQLAMEKAFKSYFGDSHGRVPCDCQDPYVWQLFAERDPLTPEYELFKNCQSTYSDFKKLARAVYKPLFQHRQELR